VGSKGFDLLLGFDVVGQTVNYRKLGQTGLLVSELSLGTWATFEDRVCSSDAYKILAEAYSGGVNHFDTAEVYADGGAEIMLGETLKALGWNRQTYIVTTKVMWGTGLKRPNCHGLTRKHVIEGCHASLKRLGLDYVDILLCHRPDPETPLGETVGAIGHLLARGDILYWGTSEWSAAMIEAVIEIADKSGVPRPVVDQSQYNLFVRRRIEIDLPPLTALGLGVCTWSPLFFGMLAGRKYEESRACRPDMEWLRDIALPTHERDEKLAIIEKFNLIASDAGLSPAGAAYSWCLGNESICSIISGVSKIEQLRSNIKELASVKDRRRVRSDIEAEFSRRGWRFDCALDAFQATS
jgi:voltage-dependent potassium channel beta subunit